MYYMHVDSSRQKHETDQFHQLGCNLTLLDMPIAMHYCVWLRIDLNNLFSKQNNNGQMIAFKLNKIKQQWAVLHQM